jgi:enoyl-CoA hydratase/carnithine racemase
MSSELHAQRRDSTLILTITDPTSRNALSEQVFAAGVEALNVAESDDLIRCVVLQGDGAHFCAGTRLPGSESARSAWSSSGQRDLLLRFHDFADALRVFPKPVIAAVEGQAIGTGFALALACDLVVASEDARFTFADGEDGLAALGGAGWQLAQRLPRAVALQMLWLPQPEPAARLHAWGLVNWLTSPGQALARALTVAEALAAAPVEAVARVKDRVNQWPQLGVSDESLSVHGDLYDDALRTAYPEG